MQMITSTDISNGYSAAQAAVLLGVKAHEVTRLYRTGAIKGRKVAGGALLLDAASVQEYKSIFRGKGRPWDAQTAWAALLMLEGGNASWLPYHRRRRLEQRLMSISAEDLVWLSRRRFTATSYSFSASFADLIKQSLSLTGISAASAADMGLVATMSLVDGYAEDVQRIMAGCYLMPSASGNCTIRTALEAPDGLLDSPEMPAAVVAADLATSLDSRERRCGLDYLEGALNAIR